MLRDQHPHVTVVMAVYHPDMNRLSMQVRSILEQVDVRVRLVLFADGPMPQVEAIQRLAKDHKEVFFRQFASNRGPADTFLCGLAEEVAVTGGNGKGRFFAFADQDDEWSPEKLATSCSLLKDAGAAAVHSDARLTDARGQPVAKSIFSYEQRDRNPSLARLFFRNNATGMTMVLSQTAAQTIASLRAHRPAGWLHDHFSAFIAASGAGLVFSDKPLVNYIQHGGNAVGARARPDRLRATGSFCRSDSETDRFLREGCVLVSRLLETDWPTPDSRVQLERLSKLLRRRGLVSAVRDFAELLSLTRRARPLLARLVWCKLALHRWSGGAHVP